MDRLRWGILGVSKINRRLIPAFAKAKSARLVGIASRDFAKARAAADEADIPHAFGSYDDLLGSPEIDAVYIPLPNGLHGEWTLKAARAGKHILCEKPLCPDAKGAAEVVEGCAAAGVKLMDGFFWPHHPRTKRLREMIDAGTIGAVEKVNGAFTFRMEPIDPNNIRFDASQGGGSLLDVGCYPVFGIRWAMGAEPARAFATAKYLHGVDVDMAGVLEFADGRSATFDCGFTQPFRTHLEIIGTSGVIFVPDMWAPPERAKFVLSVEGAEPAEEEMPPADHVAEMIDGFGRAVIHGTPVPSDPHEAVRTLRVLDALANSARDRAVVEV